MRPPPSPAHARRQTARVRPRGVVVAPLRLTIARAALLAAALAAPVAAARAQAGAGSDEALFRVTRAFEPAVTFWGGTTHFGNRSYTSEATYSYSSAFEVGLTGDYPVTRRTALMGELAIVPGAKQHVAGGANIASSEGESAFVTTADAGLAARLKANVPVFFFAGVGVLHGSRNATPLSTGAATEPRGTLALGYDGGLRSAGRVGFRAVFAAHFSKPADPSAADPADIAGVTTKSLTTDFSFRLGARVRLSGAGAR